MRALLVSLLLTAPALDEVERARAASDEAYEAHLAGRFEEAIETYRAGLALAETTTDAELEGVLSVRLGTCLMQAGHYDEAVERALHGLERLGAEGDPNVRISGHNTLGVVRQFRGDLTLAVDHYFQAIEVAVTHGVDRHLPALWLNVSTLKSYQGDHEGALEGYERARSVNVELGQGDENSHLLNCIGVSLLALDRAAEARAAFAEGLALAERVGDPRSAATQCRSLARLEFDVGDGAVALDWAERSLEWERAAENRVGVAMSQCLVADALARVGRAGDARRVLEEVTPLVDELAIRNMQRGFHDVSARAATALMLTGLRRLVFRFRL